MSKIVVCDIDGTISKVGNRIKYLEQSPKDWDAFYGACGEDKPIVPIIKLVENLMHSTMYQIVLCTGRRESCREDTFKWLDANAFCLSLVEDYG